MARRTINTTGVRRIASIINERFNKFDKGQLDILGDEAIPLEAASKALNWLTKGDKIELRRGTYLIGTEVTGVGRVTGLHIGVMANGTEVLFKSDKRGKVFYYDDVVLGGTKDWIEIGSNLLGANNNDDVAFANYSSLAGAQTWLSSPNSGLFKIMTANPGSAKDNYNASKSFKGLLRIKYNRMFLWARTADLTGLYGSFIDKGNNTTVSGESYGTGNGTTKTFAHTLAAITGVRTAYGLTITDGVETFTDNYSGKLTGSLGGTGTINYSTGAASVTFNTAPANLAAITCSYQWEDSTNNGIADFTKSATRLAGEGFIFRQDDAGGALMNILTYADIEYCFHEKRAWALALGRDDTTATNNPWRDRVGVSNWRSPVETGEGFYYIDDSDDENPVLRRGAFSLGSNAVVPTDLSSEKMDLSPYIFDKAAGVEWDVYILFACRTADSSINNRVIAYNRTWKSFDVLEWFVSEFAIYNGTLVIGDSNSQNCYQIFSGLDDDDSLINNYWEGGNSDIKIDSLKKSKKLVIKGEIGPDQEIEVFGNLDRGGFVSLGKIKGSGAYVDKGASVDVGAVTLGRSKIGGGGTQGAIPAYNYIAELTRKTEYKTDKFNLFKPKFVANKIGYASVKEIMFEDIRVKARKMPRKYRQH